VVGRIARALEKGPYLLGERFSAADIVVGSMFQYLNARGRLPAHEPVKRYLEALNAREGYKRAQAKEAEAPSS